MSLSPAKKKLLDFLYTEEYAGNGFPSKEEIAEYMGWRSSSGATAALTELHGLGYIVKVWGRTKRNGSRLEFRLKRQHERSSTQGRDLGLR
jgi:hypothetical protein